MKKNNNTVPWIIVLILIMAISYYMGTRAGKAKQETIVHNTQQQRTNELISQMHSMGLNDKARHMILLSVEYVTEGPSAIDNKYLKQ